MFLDDWEEDGEMVGRNESMNNNHNPLYDESLYQSHDDPATAGIHG